jgi:hypothetical protein
MNIRNPSASAALLISIVIFTGGVALARAQCTVDDYRVMSPSVVALHCVEGETASLSGTAIISSATVGTPDIDAKISPYPEASEWLHVDLTRPLASATKYKLVLKLVPTGAKSPKPVDIDTTSSFTVTPSLSSAHPNDVDFNSNVLVLLSASSCEMKVQNALSEARSIVVKQCYVPISQAMVKSASPISVIKTPEDIGYVKVTLERPMKQQGVPISLTGVTDIFGKVPKVDSKSRLVPPKAPASKDVSSYYLNLSDLAATGASPAWAIDARVSPPIGRLYRGFQFSPLATASVGVGQISGQSYTDTIDFGGTTSRIFEPNSVIQGLAFAPGVVFETDREFDRDNLLGTVDLRLNFAHSYNTRLRRQQSLLQTAIDREAKKKTNQEDSDDTPAIKWTLDDIKSPRFGYAYDLHGLVEAGGALRDTTIHATKGPATLNLPSYNIARFGVKVHTLFEMGRASVDYTIVGRYLTQTENSVFQTPSNTLFLKSFSGLKAYSTLTGAIGVDSAGHFAISVTYQDGFNPPKYNRSNSVLTGITLKY